MVRVDEEPNFEFLARADPERKFPFAPDRGITFKGEVRIATRLFGDGDGDLFLEDVLDDNV